MLKSSWMIVAKIVGVLTPTLVGGIFFFAIIGVFGIWIAIAGLLMAVIFALISVSFVPAEGDAR
jgi:TctA family transporter